MRLRNIRGSKETIANSDYVVQEPETHRNMGQLGNEQPVQIEVGMERTFIMDMARLHPDRNFVGIEMMTVYCSVRCRRENS
ncbi:MAG: hypothetical protein ACLTA7_04540 [Ruminococcus sp.]